MQYKRFGDTYLVRLDRGEEVLESLKAFCAKEDIRLATIQGVGAADMAVIGLYDVDQQTFHSQTLDGPLEISSLTGTVSRMNDEPYLHVHATLCDVSLESRGGHLSACHISANCELAIRVLDGSASRVYDPRTGLNDIHFD